MQRRSDAAATFTTACKPAGEGVDGGARRNMSLAGAYICSLR